ncbi:acylphosphatase [Clostridium celatum]|uniref:acylphosphatase n=1 Tax=Clostridium celatum TaxID=36834 RepID=UPI001896FF6A|nr:acylphosphatase [Clostridium celatum]MDU2264977.1 acylphosphatase [Clostridium celatum]MDU3722394.1 acylphosphatase [Clostridium celatum]MDU6294345.1 acylphosphatase [Clostridium celatum]MDY3359802.1 acylphosphatase [Clostridium celatum]
MNRYYIVVEGRVQGVGFRFFCSMTAKPLDLTGWVRNMDNGMVELEVQGSDESIEKFIRTIKKGNRFIRVDELYQKKIPIIPNERTFTERY